MTREEMVQQIAANYGKGREQRSIEQTKSYNDIELEALQRHITEKSPYVTEVRTMVDRQVNEHNRAEGNANIRLGHAVERGIADQQSRSDELERQNRYNRQAREILDYKYNKISSALAFDKASSPAKTGPEK